MNVYFGDSSIFLKSFVVVVVFPVRLAQCILSDTGVFWDTGPGQRIRGSELVLKGT